MKKDRSFNFIDITEAAAMLGVSVDTMRRWDKHKKLKAIQLTPNGKRRYKKSDIENFVKNNTGKK